MTTFSKPNGTRPDNISHLHQRIAELEQQMAVGQTLIKAFPGGALFVFDHDLRYQQVHGTLLQDGNADPDVFRGKTIWEVLPPETIDVIEPAYRAALAGQQETLEVTFMERCFTVHMLPVRNDQGQIIAGMAVAYDITEQRQTDEDLRKSQERLQFIVEGSNDGAWDSDLLTGEAYLSDRYKEMLGYQPDELSNWIDTWQQSIHPDDAPLVNQAFQDYLSDQIPEYEFEHRLRHKSGEWRWFLSRGKITMRDDQGKPTRVTGMITDIHERKRTEEELRLFQTLAENAPDAIAVAQLESGQITYANPAYCTLTGYGAETIGQSFTEVYPPEEQERLPEVIQETLEQGVWQGMLTFQRKDGTTFPGLLSGMVLRDTGGQPYAVAAIVRDMSDQIQAEEERAAMQEQIIRAQQAALRELSTPLIPLAEGLVVMPLIGSMDSNRAQQVMETLLEGVAAQRATTAILDITGLQVVDTQVADALVRAARAVRLLGAQVIITGIRPEVAQTLVGMGADLSSIVTHGSLQSGIAFAMGR
ncbi:MAG: PAS domain S-box protein [Chloroflexaceae bacterium]